MKKTNDTITIVCTKCSEIMFTLKWSISDKTLIHSCERFMACPTTIKERTGCGDDCSYRNDNVYKMKCPFCDTKITVSLPIAPVLFLPHDYQDNIILNGTNPIDGRRIRLESIKFKRSHTWLHLTKNI